MAGFLFAGFLDQSLIERRDKGRMLSRGGNFFERTAMKTTVMTGVLAGGTILAMQALAQLPGQLPSAAATPNAMSSTGSMLKGATGGCQGLIDQASSLASALQGGLKSSALSEITQAKSSLSSGDTSACMSHANKALAMVK